MDPSDNLRGVRGADAPGKSWYVEFLLFTPIALDVRARDTHVTHVTDACD